MAFNESLDSFFTDFGASVVFGAVNIKALFDSPDEFVIEGQAITGEISITYPNGGLPNLKRGSSITVDLVAYTVNNIAAIEDGKLLRATLSK